jgi:hypothetical protein
MPFSERNTDDPATAATVLFDEAVPESPSATVEHVEAEYVHLRLSWGSQELHSGSDDEIRALVLRNLQRVSSLENFERFNVRVLDEQKASQVTCLFGGVFVGVRVWRTPEGLFACGHSDFA